MRHSDLTLSVVYPSLGYLPLEEAVAGCQDLIDSFSEDEALLYEGHKLFPFLRNNCSNCAVLLTPEKRQSSVVIDIADDCDLSLMYKSLTSMMMTLSEYCQTGAYYVGNVDEEAGGRKDEAKDFLCPDEDKMTAIFQKFNPGIRFIR
jgi:hypothetical protein